MEKGKEKERYFGSVRFFKNIILTFVILVIAGLIALVVYLWYQQNHASPENDLVILPGPEQGDGRGILITPDNVDQFRNRENPIDTYVNTMMTAKWDFVTWDTPSENALVGNPEENTRVMYIEVHLELADGEFGEMVYDSPYIPLGAKLTNFALSKKLGEGVYPAIVTYYLVDDDFKVITETSVGVTINILS